MLTPMVVGSMVGAGIFSLPARFGTATGPFGAIIAWLIAGTGMLMLAFVFQSLAVRKPDLDAGIYAYPQAGFGNYLRFAAAFGFWAAVRQPHRRFQFLLDGPTHRCPGPRRARHDMLRVLLT